VRYSRLCSIRDDGIYEFKCPEGHQSLTVLRTPKHEVLFTIASNALLGGYLRDAVASFAASLERFYEFAIRVICREKAISQQEFEKCWKSISKQSERQLGAFTMLWFVEMGDPPNLLSNKMVELRNQVIHQGKIPTYQNCIEFGQAVIDVISPIERKMLDRFPASHKDECFALAGSVRKTVGNHFLF
jgi:glutamyl/glutaminyl-tRNA synthetase